MAKKNDEKSSRNTSKRVGKFAIIGVVLTLFNFAIYTLLARLIFKDNSWLWLVSAISYTSSAILAYILHSKITWKERPITKRGMIMFFVWNGISAFLISPFFTWVFGFITPVWQFAFSIVEALHLPMSYEFVESTGIFAFTTAVTMILNFIFYDRLVFGGKSAAKVTTEENVRAKTGPKVSIVVPVYNSKKYLPTCIESVINQTYQNLEIILVDDGATDGSDKIVDKYAKKDSRIKVIHQENRGQSAARNRGLEIASGDFVCFVDNDDEIKACFVDELLKAFKPEIAMTVCGMHYKRLRQKTASDVYIKPIRSCKKHETKKAYILYLLASDGRMYSSVNKLYRMETAKECSFDESLNFAEDTKFVLDYLKITSGVPAFVLKPLYVYNFGTEGSTIRSTATKWKNWRTSYKNLKDWLGPNATMREKFWLKTIYLRWRVSHQRSKKRSK